MVASLPIEVFIAKLSILQDPVSTLASNDDAGSATGYHTNNISSIIDMNTVYQRRF